MDSTRPAIEIRNLYKIYGPKPELLLGRLREGKPAPDESANIVALRDIDLSVEKGRIFVIMGLSGSGKSTLLRCINRLVEPTAGEVLIDGRDITRFDQREFRNVRSTMIGMVFQHFALLPHMTVIDNVGLGLRIRGVPRKARRERAAQALELVGLHGWHDKKPASLSGGMRQRVGLARALVMDTPILLMDEPFSALDPLIREEMQQELLRLQASLNKTIVFVTHDPNEAAAIGDDITILLKGEVVQHGRTKDVVLAPATDYVKNFIRGTDVFKVLTAGQVAELDRPAAAAPAGGEADCVTLSPDDLVALYLDRISRGDRRFVVRRADGSILGAVTSHGVLRALAAHHVTGRETEPAGSAGLDAEP